MRLFLLGFILGVSPLAAFLLYQFLHSGVLLSRYQQIPSTNIIGHERAPASLGEAPQVVEISATPVENKPAEADYQWKLVRDNYTQLVDKNEQLNAVLVYHPNCSLPVTRSVVNGRFTTQQMIKLYSDLSQSYQQRVAQLHHQVDCRQAVALFDSGERIRTNLAVAFEQSTEPSSASMP